MGFTYAFGAVLLKLTGRGDEWIEVPVLPTRGGEKQVTALT